VLLHHWCGAVLGTPRTAESTFRRKDLTLLREVSSELPPYITYSFLRWSSPSLESESPVETSFRHPSSDW
jgi:hypothetical protein